MKVVIWFKQMNKVLQTLIGILQILALIPGVSRAGINMTAARFLRFNRVDAGKISFLLSIPTLGAVTIYGIQEIVTSDDLNFSVLNIISILLSFIFSLVTMRFFLKYIQNFSLNLFVTYRIILGLGLIYLAYL